MEKDAKTLEVMMHRELINNVLNKMAAFNADHFGYSPDHITETQLETMKTMLIDLELLAEKYGIEYLDPIEDND